MVAMNVREGYIEDGMVGAEVRASSTFWKPNATLRVKQQHRP